MKQLLISVLVFISLNSFAQYQLPSPNNDAKEKYTHIVVYRTWDNHMKQYGDMMSMESTWITKIQGFHSLDEVMSWLSYKDELTQKNVVRLSENELIKIYDLNAAKEIKVKLETEEKSLPKRVEIQAEKWTEQKYVIELTGSIK
jgi:hypothetical protein